MELGDRIKEYRTKAKLSQEKVAELVGVSRQAVTKWEANQSFPSTDNLFKIAEIFGITVDMLVRSDEKNDRSETEKFFELYKAADEQRKCEKREKLFYRMRMTLLVSAGWMLLFLVSRFIYSELGDQTVLNWLFGTSPQYTSYLFGWLLSSNSYLISSLISIVPALLGKHRFSAVTLAGSAVGLFIGEPLGAYSAGEANGHDHYGWLIYIVIFTLSVICGLICEKHKKKS